jgi:thioredoxin 2
MDRQLHEAGAARHNIACPHCDALNRLAPARALHEARCGKCRQALFAGKPLELTSANFAAQTERSALPVVIDLWASWCAPCRMMAPVVERAAAALEPKSRVAKLNTETEPDLAARLGVRAIPAFIVLKDGKEVARRVGAMDYGEFVRWASGVV